MSTVMAFIRLKESSSIIRKKFSSGKLLITHLFSIFIKTLENIKDFASLKAFHWPTAQETRNNSYLMKITGHKEIDHNQWRKRTISKKLIQMVKRMIALKLSNHPHHKRLKSIKRNSSLRSWIWKGLQKNKFRRTIILSTFQSIKQKNHKQKRQ